MSCKVCRAVFLFVLLVASACILLFVTNEVRKRERLYVQLQREVVKTREATHVLQAEWAYLNRLHRIEEVSTTQLGMAPITPDRIVRPEALPKRAAPTEELIAEIDTAAEPHLTARLDVDPTQ